MAFLDERYLLSNDTALELYEGIKDLPIIDAHNHADVKAIWENKAFANLWQAEAATDHYVWEMMRKRGVPEEKITGSATDREKWQALATIFPELAGNPTFEWIHLDLKRRLGIDEFICAENADVIWEKSMARLQEADMTPQGMLKTMKVEAMCSTDDPIDSLEFHKNLGESEISGVVRPTFRPDRAMNIFKADWRDYMKQLAERVGKKKFKKIGGMIAALRETHDYFAEHGCVASDHGVEVPYGYQVDEESANEIFQMAMKGEELDEEAMIGYMSYVLNEVAEMDAEKGWVFQLHIGAVRDVRKMLESTLGADVGGDISDHMIDIVAPLNQFLNRFDGRLKVVLYCLEPHHQATLTTICRAFGENVNLGSAWWLNDSPIGMRRQLEYVGSVDVLMNCAGMVSDSRKLLSYGSRNEMYRRTLSDVVGKMVDLGQMPMFCAERICRHLAYERPKSLFAL
jgi:glucuronate isomerase